jgi:hypothetical protein
MIESIGGRKVLVVGVAVLLGVGAVFLRGDVPPGFLSLVQWAVGLFVLGNGIEHAATAYSSAGSSEGADHSADLGQLKEAAADHGSELSGLRASVDALAANDVALAQNVGIVQQAISLIIRKYGIDRLPDPPANSRG